jgi:hypothetical protein
MDANEIVRSGLRRVLKDRLNELAQEVEHLTDMEVEALWSNAFFGQAKRIC